jgi:hypothetical protein
MLQRVTLVLMAIMGWGAAAAPAQLLPVRSRDYLFLTNVSDARALWVNPAGLAIVPEASLLAELTFERIAGDPIRVGQFAVGFNSRGFSLGYQRNRLVGEKPVGILRTGMGVPFHGGSLGLAASRVSQDTSSSYELDVGIVFVPSVLLQMGLAVRHIGRAEVRSAQLPVTTVGGVQLTTSLLQVSLETAAAERLAPGESGFDFAHRAGVQVAVANRLPVTAIGTIDLGSNLHIDRFNIGVAIGGTRQVTTVGSAVSGDKAPVFELFSATFLATNPLTAQR